VSSFSEFGGVIHQAATMMTDKLRESKNQNFKLQLPSSLVTRTILSFEKLKT
jgi:hypothetical protein